MASSRRTFDTDSITLRTVYAKNGNNTNIPALRVLTADGSGGTYWRQPSSFGTNPSFNQIITDAGTFTADLSYNTFRMTSGEGIGMTAGPTGQNQTYLFAKAFGQVDVSGADSLYAYSNDTLKPSFTLAATGGIQLRSDPQRNIVYIDGPLTTTISSGYYAFNKFLVVPTVSTIQPTITPSLGNYLIANSPSSQITFSGVGDVILSTIYSTNTIFFTVSSYSAKDFLGISTIATTFGATTISTLDALYVKKFDFSTATGLVSTNSYSNASSVTSTIYGISSYFVGQFNILTNLINQRATIVQLNSNINNFQTSLSSFSTNYIELNQYLSSTEGLITQVSSINTISSASSLFFFGGTFYNFSTGSILYDQSDVSTLSTTTGGSISTNSNVLNRRIEGNYLSTNSTVNALGTIGYVSSASLTSTIEGLGTFRYVSSLSLASTVTGLGTIGYISTLGLNATLTSTTQGVFDNFGTYGYISSLSLQSTLQSTTQGLRDYLANFGYISTASLASTLQSTTNGLNGYFGQFGYISTATLTSSLASTVQGLGSIGFVSTATLDFALVSSYTGFENFLGSNFISSPSLTSTTIGLGTFGYISTLSLISTVSSLTRILSSGTSSISLKSSIIYKGSNNTITASVDGTNYNFTTANVSFDTFSTYIHNTSKMFLDVNENIFLPGSKIGSIGSYRYLSSLITYRGSDDSKFLMANTNYVDGFLLQYSNAEGPLNVYSKNITFELDVQFIKNSFTSSLSVEHFIYDAGSVIEGNSIIVRNSSTNSIFVTILN